MQFRKNCLKKAKDAAKSTRENDAFRFTICYDASHAENLKVLLQTAGVYPEKETENTFTAYMTMEQLKLVKSLEFVEQAIEADAMPQEVRKALVSQKPKKEDEPQEPAAPATATYSNPASRSMTANWRMTQIRI